MCPDFKLYHNTTSIKTAWYWYKNRHICPWSRIGSPETNPSTYGQLICDRGGKNIQWGKESLFSKWCCEKLGSYMQRRLNHVLTSCTKINTSQVRDVNVRPEVINLLEESIGSMLSNIGLSSILGRSVSSGKGCKSKNKHMGLHQTKKLWHNEGN